MNSASLLVFPSLYEGFGLPPLEAALMGVPSVCSRKPAMTEILIDCALFADPNDSIEWSEKIYKLIHEPNLRSKIIHNARARANELCWRDSSKKLLQVLSKV
jgi:glycosyltransferase involved in cell wall biosynthesis